MKSKLEAKQNRKKAKFLSRDEFLAKVQEHSGWIDIKSVEAVYDGIIYTIEQELIQKGGVELPGLAYMYLHYVPPKESKNRYGTFMRKSSHQLRMRPLRTVVAKFKEIEEYYGDRIMDPAVKHNL